MRKFKKGDEVYCGSHDDKMATIIHVNGKYAWVDTGDLFYSEGRVVRIDSLSSSRLDALRVEVERKRDDIKRSTMNIESMKNNIRFLSGCIDYEIKNQKKPKRKKKPEATP